MHSTSSPVLSVSTLRNRASTTLRDRTDNVTEGLTSANAMAGKVTSQYNTAKASFDSEMATMRSFKKFHSGQYDPPSLQLLRASLSRALSNASLPLPISIHSSLVIPYEHHGPQCKRAVPKLEPM